MINYSGAIVQLGQVAAAVGAVWCHSVQPAGGSSRCAAVALFAGEDEASLTELTLIESVAL